LKVSDKLSGNTFNEKEFREYMQEQQDHELETEEFELDL
jgi:hypothetical protein